jgi:hypothetical protein
MSEEARVLGIIVAEFGTSGRLPSRLADDFCGRPVLAHAVDRLLRVQGVGEVAVVTDRLDEAARIVGPEDRVRFVDLVPRPPAIDKRVRIGRAWNLLAWRGGAGQYTAFDEEYHPAAIAQAAAGAFEGKCAEHVLVVDSHAVMLNVELTSALVHHHLHKNHEMRVTYTPAAPGLSGMALRGDIVKEMGEKGAMPWQLLAYDPKQPIFDTLIREACMQVDPALSKVPNRFCVDTQRSWDICIDLAKYSFGTLAEMCLAAARAVAPGVNVPAQVSAWPREVEIELTARRLTHPPGAVPAEIAAQRAVLDAGHWVRWLERHGRVADDLLVTVGGEGDPLLHPGLPDVLAALRKAGALSICVQTDLIAPNVDGLLTAVSQGNVDIVSVTTYGHSAKTYENVAGADWHSQMMKNLERLAETTRAQGGMPLVIPRLLKVRDTIPELEPFFDFWVERTGWAVIDGPTDRAGTVPFGGVVDMAPPRRKPCRRIWERMIIRSDGTAAACDQDLHARLATGHIEQLTIPQLWRNLQNLRDRHAAGKWNGIDPCQNCREWHRP